MAAARPILGFVSIIILAGGVLLDLFVVLSGAVEGGPISKTYFLQSTTAGWTSGHKKIEDPARWTYFAVCGVKHGLNHACKHVQAAFPFDPTKNFDTTTGIPGAFVGTDRYYLLSRFAWVFYIIALFFAVIALLLSVFALCARIGAFLTGATTMAAFFFQMLAAALMTAWTVLAQKHLKHQGQTAKLGVYAYGFTWGALGCYLICTILFCVGGGVSGKNKKNSNVSRKRSTRSDRSRGSLVDSESQRRVKDEYE